MDFISSRELRVNPRPVFERLEGEREVIITSHGKPVALMLGVNGEDVEEVVRSVRRARAELAVSRMRRAAAEKGLAETDVESEIEAARRGR